MRKSSRKNKMSTAKLGVMFIVAAMALAGVGAGYAAWFDTVTVHGTVSTGDVDINVEDYSGTYVWKVYGDGAPDYEIYEWHGFMDEMPDVEALYPDCTVELISKAYAAQAVDTAGVLIDDAITVIYDNLFPCIDFKVDYLFQYDGSIPAKIEVTDPLFTGVNADFFNTLIWTLPGQYPDMGYCYGEMWLSNAAGEEVVNIADLEGYQLHEGDYILLVITLHLAQNNGLMNMDASFTAGIEVVQWNEYPYDGGECGDEPTFHKADLMLVLDTSNSISEDPELILLRDAANAFITAIHQDDSITGQTQFQTTGWLDLHLTNIEANAHTAINNIIATSGMTNLFEGLDKAYDELMLGTYGVISEPNSEGDRAPDTEYPDYIIVITDGATNRPLDPGDPPEAAYPLDKAKSVADACDTAGITIYAVGVGVSTASVPSPYTGTYEDFLETYIATTPGHYFSAADYASLATALQNIVNPP